MKVEKIVGLVLILSSLATLIEAIRLRAMPGLRYGLGPGTFPFFVGGALLLLGIYFLVTGGKDRKSPIILPKGRIAKTMTGTMGAMILYGVALPFLGYSLSTLFASVILFKVVGKYGWLACLLIGLSVTVLLNLIFRYAVFVPFPSGQIWRF